MSIPIPHSHRDLLVDPIHGVLSTLMPDGQPQSSIVWVDYDGTYVLINTTLERQKGRNMRTNPKVALLVVDPKDCQPLDRGAGQRGGDTTRRRRSPCRQTHTVVHGQTALLW